ncbi:MAG: glutathione peroxidase [Bacteroidota bacterium]|nr:glutathione peroxidase [Bacteroidota bacterium]
MSKSIFQFTVNDLKGKNVSLKDYQGKVLLIVNTASQCGYTPQFQGLNELYHLYHQKGFEILAFPSNDFGNQEPLEAEAIQEFCSSEFQVYFRVFDKINVKGKNAHPLYKFLSNKSLNGSVNIAPHWNFHKYLVDSNGRVVDYFWTFTNPMSGRIRKKIEKLLI